MNQSKFYFWTKRQIREYDCTCYFVSLKFTSLLEKDLSQSLIKINHAEIDVLTFLLSRNLFQIHEKVCRWKIIIENGTLLHIISFITYLKLFVNKLKNYYSLINILKIQLGILLIKLFAFLSHFISHFTITELIISAR